MSLLIQCVYATKDNKKLSIVKKCITSFMKTVDLSKHRWVIINNSCNKETEEYLNSLDCNGLTIIHNKENVGTARGINQGLRMREVGEICIKLDDDIYWSKIGWADEMEEMIKERPEIGILGLKRDDVYGSFVKEGKLWWSHDIFGTCTAYNPAMIDKIGGLVQPSKYGFDDSLYSVRSEAAGFKNAFLVNIKIKNLDNKETAYTYWKRREAVIYLTEAGTLMELIKTKQKDYYYGFD